MSKSHVTEIPLWIVASIGKQVVLATDFAGPCETYAKGCSGLLSAIMVDSHNYDGVPYALVALDPQDDSYLENFRFDEIAPASGSTRFRLNMEEGLIAF